MLRNEKGFTLIEIIAVLVILGILAAVAIPKYFDLMNQSRLNAAQTAIAELQGRMSNVYANKLLNNNPSDCATVLLSVDPTTLGDFLASKSGCVGTPAVVTFTVNSVKGVNIASAVTGTWTQPTQ